MRLFNTQEDLVELYDLHNKIILVVLSVFEGNDEKIAQAHANFPFERQKCGAIGPDFG